MAASCSNNDDNDHKRWAVVKGVALKKELDQLISKSQCFAEYCGTNVFKESQ
jgi:hypothetical protein